MMVARLWTLLLLVTAALAAGCMAPDAATLPAGAAGEPLKLAFSVKDDSASFVETADPLAAWIERVTGRETSIVPVQDESAAIAAVVGGDAQAAFLDGGAAWVAWQRLDLEAIAADTHGDGRTYYVATAWVLAESDIRTVEDLRSRVSCHTGDLKSAGMLMPMGYLIREGLVDVSALPDDVTSIRLAAERFFKDPIVGGDYVGAFQCLSEGRGEVAFVKDSTWDDFCGGDEKRDWCRAREDYRVLQEFARVPSHPVMVAPDLPVADRALLQYALLTLNDSPQGRDVLRTVLNTRGITHVSTVEHLGSYGEMLSVLPGIDDHVVKGVLFG